MTSARNEAPKGVRCGRGCPLPTGGEAGEGVMPLTRIFSIFELRNQNGKFWCILGANLLARGHNFFASALQLRLFCALNPEI